MSSSIFHTAMAPSSPLLRLPLEVRCMIFEEVFHEAFILCPAPEEENKPYKAFHILWNTGLHTVNRQLYHETFPAFLKNPIFDDFYHRFSGPRSSFTMKQEDYCSYVFDWTVDRRYILGLHDNKNAFRHNPDLSRYIEFEPENRYIMGNMKVDLVLNERLEYTFRQPVKSMEGLLSEAMEVVITTTTGGDVEDQDWLFDALDGLNHGVLDGIEHDAPEELETLGVLGAFDAIGVTETLKMFGVS